MTEAVYHPATTEIGHRRAEPAPAINEAFDNFSRAVFAEGALLEKTKQLIAVAIAHVTQCPYCIQGHTRLAQRKGADPQEIMEAIWVAADHGVGRHLDTRLGDAARSSVRGGMRPVREAAGRGD
ncbi:carboxymuconolactone decarboxylase family protein [Streptomyces sp. NBC_01320]|uniref:carboxymuconolactone decarboxylase family protein n=1 Tax=Streptomyces sp. NBC_01320 TaxID=2903824 RepID=UPI002E13D77D|nr:carboxymuconolactone decarboxylase family protein [Streptomyces sp. NBC_01320]